MRLIQTTTLLVVGWALFLLFRPPRMPLTIVSADPNFRAPHVVCTFGTNHVYYYGNAWDRVLDPLMTRWSDTNANRLRTHTESPSTVVWVRFSRPDYGIIPKKPTGLPEPFRAQLIKSTEAVVPLQAVGARMQSYNRRFLVMGWVLPGDLESYRDSRLRIESTNGTETVTFHVP